MVISAAARVAIKAARLAKKRAVNLKRIGQLKKIQKRIRAEKIEVKRTEKEWLALEMSKRGKPIPKDVLNRLSPRPPYYNKKITKAQAMTRPSGYTATARKQKIKKIEDKKGRNYGYRLASEQEQKNIVKAVKKQKIRAIASKWGVGSLRESEKREIGLPYKRQYSWRPKPWNYAHVSPSNVDEIGTRGRIGFNIMNFFVATSKTRTDKALWGTVGGLSATLPPLSGHLIDQSNKKESKRISDLKKKQRDLKAEQKAYEDELRGEPGPYSAYPSP